MLAAGVSGPLFFLEAEVCPRSFKTAILYLRERPVPVTEDPLFVHISHERFSATRVRRFLPG